MTLPTGESERVMRAAVVSRIRAVLPRARVIHELNCNGRRADLAAVTTDRVLLFEIKSEKDTLDRARAQLERFYQSSHGVVLVLHEKHFDRTPYQNGSARCVDPFGVVGSWRRHIWIYPEGAARGTPLARTYAWEVPRATLSQPAAGWLLGLLWRAELCALAARHEVKIKSADNMKRITQVLVWNLNGRQICHGVCRALRRRSFAHADPPIRSLDRVRRVA